MILDLTRILLPITPPKKPLDESSFDLFRAFYMYNKDSDPVEKLKIEVITDDFAKMLNY